MAGSKTPEDEERREAVGTRRRCHGRETNWPIIEAWEFDVVLGDSAELSHHGHPTMLNLCGAMVTKSILIAFLREARWVKKPTGATAPSWLAGWKDVKAERPTGTSKKPGI